MKNRQLRLWVVFIAASAAVLLAGSGATGTDPFRPAIAASVDPGLPREGHPKIEPALYRLIHPSQEAILDAARSGLVLQRVDAPDESEIQIVAELAAGPAASFSYAPAVRVVRSMIAALGGVTETTYENLVQGRLPAAAVETLAQSDLVQRIRRPMVPAVHALSEGVAKTGANQWQSLKSYRSGGVHPKIAILDLGFKGYAALLGGDLPANVTTRSFRADGDLSTNQVHGAACAEIVHDMCPDASLYLVNFNTDVEQHNAVTWLIQQGVQIISYSIGWWNAGDGKGTGPIDADVTKAAQAGIIWASSAGNDAYRHWEGTFSDTNSNTYHNFEAGNEFLQFAVPANMAPAVFLNWDDWGTWNGANYSGSGQDYDLYLYYWWAGSWHFVDSSTGYQNGTQWPTESISNWVLNVSTNWGVLIRRFSTTRNCKLELFTAGNSGAIQYDVPAGSVTIPADSPDAVTAGATWVSDDSLEYFSSRGPTHDGRTKPDIASPDGVSTTTYGPGDFFGTSAAAPHLAGAFGLMKDKSAYTLAQIKTILLNRALPLGNANSFGAGRLNLLK